MDPASWGDDIAAMGTFERDRDRNWYNLYIVDPSEQQIRAYTPAADGGGFPAKSSGWLDSPRAVDKMSSLYIDGDMFIADDGSLRRYTSGKGDGWGAEELEDGLLRPAPTYSLVAGAGDARQGFVYAYDRPNERVVAYDKASGDFSAQYRADGGLDDWDDVRGMYLIPGIDEEPPSLVWASATGVHEAILEEIADPEASPDPSSDDEAQGSNEPTPEP